MSRENRIFVYRLKEATRGFRVAWQKTKLTWNGEPAGLVNLNCTDPVEDEEIRYSQMLGFEVKALENLPIGNLIWDLVDFTKLVLHR